MKLNLERIIHKIGDLSIQKKEEQLIISEKRKRGRPSKQLYLPQKIHLTKDVIEAFGLFFGEGTKTQDYNRIEFGNTEPRLLRKFINLLKEFNIKTSEIRVKINIYEDDAKILSDDELKKYWSKKLHIPLQNFQKVSWYHKKGTRKKAAGFGTVQLRVYHKLLAKIFRLTFYKVVQLALSHTQIAQHFLRGIFAAEGFVERRGKSIHKVGVSCKKDKEIVYKLLHKVKLIPGKYNERMRSFPIRGIENFGIILKLKLFELHPKKHKKFMRSIVNHRYFYKISHSTRIP